MRETTDLGLETLLDTKEYLGLDLEDSLVQKSFIIQKKYQFTHERTLSVQAMENLIEEHISNQEELIA